MRIENEKSKGNKTQQIGEIISEYQLPEDAVPMSYIGHIYVHGELDGIEGNFADGVADIKNFYQDVVEINYSHEYMKFYSSIDSIDVSDYQSIKLRKY